MFGNKYFYNNRSKKILDLLSEQKENGPVVGIGQGKQVQPRKRCHARRTQKASSKETICKRKLCFKQIDEKNFDPIVTNETETLLTSDVTSTVSSSIGLNLNYATASRMSNKICNVGFDCDRTPWKTSKKQDEPSSTSHTPNSGGFTIVYPECNITTPSDLKYQDLNYSTNYSELPVYDTLHLTNIDCSEPTVEILNLTPEIEKPEPTVEILHFTPVIQKPQFLVQTPAPELKHTDLRASSPMLSLVNEFSEEEMPSFNIEELEVVLEESLTEPTSSEKTPAPELKHTDLRASSPMLSLVNEFSEEEMPSFNIEELEVVLEESLTEPTSSEKKNNEKYPPSISLISKEERKKNACPFCEPQQLINCSNYWRHLIRNHANELEVQKLVSLPKGSGNRRQLLADLRNRGNYLFNAAKNHHFIPSRRPLKDQSPKKSNFVTCADCLILVKRKNFFLHRKICKKNVSNIVNCNYCKTSMTEGLLPKHEKNCEAKETCANEENGEKTTAHRQKRVLQRCSEFVDTNLIGASQDLIKHVLPLQRIDEISQLVKNDPLILSVGSKLRSNHREARSGLNISSKMRDLAKILQKMKTGNINIRCFKDCLMSKNVQLLFKAVKELSGLDEETGTVKIPSMPGRIKGQLNLALLTVKNDIKIDPNIPYDTKKELIFDYQTTEDIIKTDWRFEISTNAAKSMNEQHRNKGILMPLEEDIKTASTYLTKQENRLYDMLKNTPEPTTFEKMCEVLIADLIIFNCRRAGEVSRAELKHYLNRGDIRFEGDLKSVLSDSELAAKDSLTMFYVPGKRDRTVPIILTDVMKKCVDLLIAVRNQLNVGSRTLLFPRLYSDRPYDSCRIIRDLKTKVSLKMPDHFTSTGLRHEIATHSHLQDSENPGYRKVLFSHMGHTEAVHNEKYVTPLPVLQVSKIGANLLRRRSANISSSTEQQNVFSSLKKTGKKRGELSSSLNSLQTKDQDEDPNYEPDADCESEEEFVILPKQQKTHVAWTLQEQEIVIRAFKSYFYNSTPGKKLCEDLINKNDCLKTRTWKQINAYVENVSKRRKKICPELVYLFEK